MFLKKNVLLVLLFGTLIGLNETLIGSFHIPYRSVFLSSIALALLSIARIKIPQTGSSLLIILIAILFKLNNVGLHNCTTNALLCGPSALLSLGIGFELFAALFLSKTSIKYLNIILTCILTSIVGFSLFGILNAYILKAWDTPMLLNYIFVKATFTAIVSAGISSVVLYLAKFSKDLDFARWERYLINSILGCLIIAFWLFGTFTQF
jgi:hypothetical protein